jgi:Xaa-Pro aminopeptidase
MPAAAPPRTKADSPHATRLSRVRKALSKLGADALLVTNPTDVGYLTGFLGGDSYMLVPAGSGKKARPVVISDFRYEEELEHIADLADIHIRRKGLLDATADVIADRRSIAVQAEHLTVAELAALERLLGPDRLIRSEGVVAELRRTKDESEIALIKKAIRIQQDALSAVLPTITPGETEMAVAARLEAEMKLRGSTEPGFTTIVGSGPNGSLPHYRAGPAKIAKNKPILIDWGAVYQGYHGDMTRVFVLGKWPPKIAEIYKIVLDAQMQAAAALAPGKTCHEIDAIARDHIRAAGYGDQFGHGLGHGMGMKGHEDPRLNPLFADAVLEVGNVVTVEPGIYLPEIGGVRIEDDYVITPTGAKNLCSMPKDLEWATL